MSKLLELIGKTREAYLLDISGVYLTTDFLDDLLVEIRRERPDDTTSGVVKCTKCGCTNYPIDRTREL